jgi:hypothetical protein
MCGAATPKADGTACSRGACQGGVCTGGRVRFRALMRACIFEAKELGACINVAASGQNTVLRMQQAACKLGFRQPSLFALRHLESRLGMPLSPQTCAWA